MSITLPTYKRREMPLLPRSQRVRAIITTGLRREFRRPAAIVVIVMGAALVSITSIILILIAGLIAPPGTVTTDLSFFFSPASNPAIWFFVTLMAAVIGSGLIADDLHSMAFTLYLSRPITQADYLAAKAAILAPLIAVVAILPLVITPLLAALLFPASYSWGLALEAMGVSLGVGLFFTAFYTSVALFLSSLTKRKGYAAAGVFALNFGLTIPAAVLASPAPTGLGIPELLYFSPWDDYLAVARWAFGAPGNPIEPAAAFGILLAATVLAALFTYIRMKAVEVVSG